MINLEVTARINSTFTSGPTCLSKLWKRRDGHSLPLNDHEKYAFSIVHSRLCLFERLVDEFHCSGFELLNFCQAERVPLVQVLELGPPFPQDDRIDNELILVYESCFHQRGHEC